MTDVLSRSLKQILMWTEHRHVFSFWARFINRFLYKLGKIVQEEYCMCGMGVNWGVPEMPCSTEF
jgi:hypothetical protein